MTNTANIKRIHHAGGRPAVPRVVRVLLAMVFASYVASMAVLLVFRGYHVAAPEITLTPFSTIRFYFDNYDLRAGSLIINVWGNILTFVPLGILLQVFLKNKHLLLTIGLVALASFTAEALQYILVVGHTDIDDLMLNTLGGVVGVLVYRVVRAACKKQTRTDAVLLGMLVLMCLFIWPVALNQFVAGYLR